MNKPVLSPAISAEDQAAFKAAVREGIEAVDAGRLAPIEPVADWLATWGTEGEPPPPERVRITAPAKADLVEIRRG